jgi:hypothetical protein
MPIVVTPDEAIRRAREWVAGSGAPAGDIGIYEFDLGYVVWPSQPSHDHDRPPHTVGGARAVIDKATGELTVWPMLPPSSIAEQYRITRRAHQRFPQQVFDDLWAAGWRPGRNVAATVDEWLDRTGIGHELPLSGHARAALDEFGGLVVPQRGRSGKPGGGFTSRFYPGPEKPTTPEIHEFASIIGRAVFPIGGNDDGPSHVVIDTEGRVFLLNPFDDFFAGGSLDEAVVWMTRYSELPSVDPDGTW